MKVMETDVSQDFEDYWNEYKIIQETRQLDSYLDEECPPEQEFIGAHLQEGAVESEWLSSAGLAFLTEAFDNGCEVPDSELEPAITHLSTRQADAVRLRVRSLNHTVRQRGRQLKARHKKPDIRDVFRDFESLSSSSRSRSATPDSDSNSPPMSWTQTEITTPIPKYTDPNVDLGIYSKKDVRRMPSAPVLPSRDIFRRSNRSNNGIVASESDGITMVGFQRLGTVRGFKFEQRPSTVAKDRNRSGSDPLHLYSTSPEEHTNTPSMGLAVPQSSVTRSHGCLYESSDNHRDSSQYVGFEQMWQNNNYRLEKSYSSVDENTGRTWPESLSDEDLAKLRPLLFLELSAMFDSAGIPFHKGKPHKRKRREEGTIFGVSLSNLVDRDQAIANRRVQVPLILQKVLGQLEKRGLGEQGLLRMAAPKAKVEKLCGAVEKYFYAKPDEVDQLLEKCSVHDLVALLKRLLRDLPELLLTHELINLFYQTSSVSDTVRALNLLVLLLPTENRASLRALVRFMSKLVEYQQRHDLENKMTEHNVAMIIAPSLFPPRSVHLEKKDLHSHLDQAARSCRLTETLMNHIEELCLVPTDLMNQLRHNNEIYQCRLKENNNPVRRFLGKKKPDVVTKRINNELDYQEGVIRVDAPQFRISGIPLFLTDSTTVGEVILKIVEEAAKQTVTKNGVAVKTGRKDLKSRALTELAPNGNLSCLLTTADPDMATRTHFLYETGGNIGQRRIEPTANMMAVYQTNPNAQWFIKCDHRNGIAHV
ncbi:rho GTPase-activating protein conundrum-like [Adelges cooleyi]|uniref:rho GTPase-activating protein conundrum-like n=1 Tax=Adelges cooleyi TaxID=133065 RepID=UPI00217F6C64|nr:rho GTPase-activating protein conundrum-like [Adelges cooleyi]XP_050423551.1 rho GTPase-activating protein conundrum-like [Adelges cooleyi]